MMENKRNELRTCTVNTIHYADRTENFWAISSNVSQSGINIYTNRPLEEGDIINLASKALWTAPKEARVAWSMKVKANLFKVGIEFSNIGLPMEAQ